MKLSLIYIDDQIQNLECYRELLEPDFDVIGHNDASTVGALLDKVSPHGIMLDIHMPGTDGFTLYKQITEHPRYNGCPIFFISGDISAENKLKSYQNGGIDFIPRDMRYEEVTFRLSNKIKHYLAVTTKLHLGNMIVDVEALSVSIGSKLVDLTLIEYRILLSILRSCPQVLTRADIIKKIWNTETVKPGTVNTHITNLKSKVEDWNYTLKIKDEKILVERILG
jgi:DNA-binding response OmpR family regulator